MYTRHKISLGLAGLVSDMDLKSWKHFKGIHIPEIECTEVHLIIGNDVPQALIPMEVRAGNAGEPYAVRTICGWTINGPLDGTRLPSVTSYYIDTDSQLNQQVRKFWELEVMIQS